MERPLLVERRVRRALPRCSSARWTRRSVSTSIHRLQQIFYVECPQIALTYPDTLEIGNTAKWEGYTPFLDGLAFLNAFNMDTYLNLKPKSAEEEDGGTSATLWIVIAVIAVLVVIAVVLLMRRGGTPKAMEE